MTTNHLCVKQLSYNEWDPDQRKFVDRKGKWFVFDDKGFCINSDGMSGVPLDDGLVHLFETKEEAEEILALYLLKRGAQT